MAPELRKTGISVVSEVPWGTHFCTFYETKQDLLDILIPFFKAGLESQEFCLWIISNSELLTMQEAMSALEEALPDLDRHLSEGSIELFSHDQWFLEEGTFDLSRVAHRFKEKHDAALAKGYVGMRLNGGPAWIYEEDQKQLIAFEKEADKVFHNLRLIASCTYPIPESTVNQLLEVARTHQFVLTRRHGDWAVFETPELMQAKAELKKLNEELELRVMERTRELAAANEQLKREIAERLRAEDRIRLITDTIPVMAWSMGPDGNVDFLNRRWTDYAGLSLEQYVADPMGPIHPQDTLRVVEKWRARMALGEAYDEEMRLRRADGEYRWFLVRVAPLRDESGKVIKWYGVSTDIDDLKKAEKRLTETTEQLRALSASLQSAREEESTRIAREIHDQLGGALTSLRWDLEEVEDVISQVTDSAHPVLRQKIEAMMVLTESTLDTVRRLSSELRPMVLDELGLLEAFEWQAQQFEHRTGIAVQFECSLEKIDLTSGESTAVFRILQEALTNIQRHAQATKVTITVKQEHGELFLTVKDNGKGITEKEKWDARSLGLLGMRERAHLIGAKIDITGMEGKGTLVAVRVSIPESRR